jgi:hypothetical protein
VEAIILLPDQGSVEVFRSGEGTLENPAVHDSASSAAGEAAAAPVRAYAVNGDADIAFELPLSGARARKNPKNPRMPPCRPPQLSRPLALFYHWSSRLAWLLSSMSREACVGRLVAWTLSEGPFARLRSLAACVGGPGGRINENLGANERVFGGAASSPRDILSGLVRPPHEFKVCAMLLGMLQSLQCMLPALLKADGGHLQAPERCSLCLPCSSIT